LNKFVSDVNATEIYSDTICLFVQSSIGFNCDNTLFSARLENGALQAKAKDY